MTFWNVVRIVLEGYLHSIFISTFRDINYIKWTQNNVTILPRYFPIINLNQLSLNPTKEDISLPISPMSYKGRRNTRHNEQSICSRNSLTDKCQRVYWLPMRLLPTLSGYGSFLTNKGNDTLSFSTCCVDCYKSWPSGRGAQPLGSSDHWNASISSYFWHCITNVSNYVILYQLWLYNKVPV